MDTLPKVNFSKVYILLSRHYLNVLLTHSLGCCSTGKSAHLIRIQIVKLKFTNLEYFLSRSCMHGLEFSRKSKNIWFPGDFMG